MRFILVAVLALAVAGVARAADDAAATVGSTTITRAELEKHVKPRLIEIDNERFEALKEGLDEMVADELMKQEAAARKISPEQLEQQEVTAKVTPPTDAEIQQVYDANKAQLQGQTLEAVKPRIVEFLNEQKAQQRKAQFIDELKTKYKTVVSLKPPVVEVGTGGRPEKGPKDAPVTMIVFSDYECPFCRRAEATVEQVLKTYEGKIRYVFRDYPLPFHQKARPAAVAANCAIPQGKYWEYNQKLFTSDLGPDSYKKMAGDLGMDQKKFDECVAKNDQASIEKDVADGGAVGVNGTPAFFINGRMLSGAQPFEAFKDVIDQEIAQAGQKKS
jgi:protein-disulfide isomerase